MFADVVDHATTATDDALLGELRSIEGRRREDAAREAVLLAELERRQTYRIDHHATMWGLLRTTLHWSDRECRDAMRLARFVADRPDAGEALFEAWVSVANLHELARATARVDRTREGDDADGGMGPVAARELGELLRVAGRSEFDDLRIRVREWERRHARHDCDAAAADAHEHRSAQVRVDADGGEIHGRFGLLDAVEIAEIYATFVDAQWRTDWERAVAEHGDQASPALLARTAAQRNADALLQIFRDAASRPPGSKAPEPVVNVHVDHATFMDILTEARLLPERDIDPFDDPTPHVLDRTARTGHGHTLDHTTILQLLLDAHVRIIIRDDHGIPIRWGRTRRLFDGAARDAVRILSTRCTHPGCRVPVTACETDHTLDWSKGGPTDPTNGNPRCRRHNNTKNHGHTVTRDQSGTFHTHRPDGTEIT